ncbi:beta-phosphoglucomutase family hydrolase [Chlorobium limicola]|uniref:Beta-phosphoglucomutase n=1 Tax=Chlorobium limicola TaxID=1092 RepID=A0A117MJF2_CHLLI|nr:beta-phosphoglucomutase family hydrolase [Chlorobium limicola]KUL20381.1 beta-phosphoglucomutase [Chlorobium limicola]
MILPTKKYAFIFDMDGVLTDNMKLHAASWVELFRDYGLEGLDPERYLVETAGMKGPDVLRYFLDPDISSQEAERLTELKDFLYRVNSRSLIKPLSGLHTFLEHAGMAGIALAVGTGSGAKNTDYVLGLLETKRFFQAIVGSHHVKEGKPAPDIFLRAAELLGVEPADCIVFEDALPGIEAASRAGMSCVALTTTNSRDSFSVCSNVLEIIDDFMQLDPVGLLERLHESRTETL